MKTTGKLKQPGTEITFTSDSAEALEIIKSGSGQLKQALPADLPGREHFAKAGFDSIQSLAVLEDWTQVKGIGPKKAEELDNYFQSKTKGE
jgi:hypothetical protein